MSMEANKGHCKHGEFILAEGCPLCIAERQAAKDEDNAITNIVKVKYYSETSGEASGREYAYFTAEPLNLGDLVNVPVRDHVQKAVVTATDVDEAEIESFRASVKTIPSGSKRPGPASLAEAAEAAGAEVTEVKVELPAAETPPVAQAASLFDQPAPNAWRTGEEEVRLEPDPPAKPPALAVIETQVGRPTTELFQLYQEAAGLLQFAKKRVIAKNEDLKPATDDLAIIAKCKKAMVERKNEIVGPLKARLDAINQAFADLMYPVFEADRLTREKVTAFDNEQRRKAAEAKRIEDEKFKLSREEAALKNGEYTVDLGTAEAPPPVPEHTRTDLGTLGGRDNWKARVVDFKLLDDQWKLPNESLLNSHARTTKGERPIPGVEFYNDRSVTMRTK